MSNYERGFIAENDIVITGYGLTMTTIETWLTNHHIDTELSINHDQIGEALDQKFPNNQITYTYVKRFDEGLLYIENPYPQKKPITLASQDGLDFQLSNAINYLYHVPTELHNDLIRFVDKYADTIAVADFYD